MKLRTLNYDELAQVYEGDLRAAFPPSELKSLRSMEGMLRRGIYDPLCLEDERGERLGYILLWKHRDGRYVLIDYLCVPASRRGAASADRSSGRSGTSIRRTRCSWRSPRPPPGTRSGTA